MSRGGTLAGDQKDKYNVLLEKTMRDTPVENCSCQERTYSDVVVDR